MPEVFFLNRSDGLLNGSSEIHNSKHSVKLLNVGMKYPGNIGKGLVVWYTPWGELFIFSVHGRANGKCIVLPHIGTRTGTDFHNFGIRNGTIVKSSVQGIKSGLVFRKVGVRSKVGYNFGKIGKRNGYVFETSMARP